LNAIRLPEKDFELGGFLIPKGVPVVMNAFGMTWDEKYFAKPVVSNREHTQVSYHTRHVVHLDLSLHMMISKDPAHVTALGGDHSPSSLRFLPGRAALPPLKRGIGSQFTWHPLLTICRSS